MFENVFEILAGDACAVVDTADVVTGVAATVVGDVVIEYGVYSVLYNGVRYMLKYDASGIDLRILGEDYSFFVDYKDLDLVDEIYLLKSDILDLHEIKLNNVEEIKRFDFVDGVDDEDTWDNTWALEIFDISPIDDWFEFECGACPWWDYVYGLQDYDYALGLCLYEFGVVPESYSGKLSQLGWEARGEGWGIDKISTDKYIIWFG